jgi:ribonuclease P protein component
MVYAKPGLPTVARLGVTVSKKTAPLAVTRNYARRVVREVFRRHLAAFAGVDLVIRVQKPFPPKAFSLIETELLGALPTLRAKVEKCRA